jgi:hypothetical protein
MWMNFNARTADAFQSTDGATIIAIAKTEATKSNVEKPV